jgi:hypothetical protein
MLVSEIYRLDKNLLVYKVKGVMIPATLGSIINE